MPLEHCTASQFYHMTSFVVGGGSINVKLWVQKDLGTNFAQEKQFDIPDCRKYVSEARGKFTQYYAQISGHSGETTENKIDI